MPASSRVGFMQYLKIRLQVLPWQHVPIQQVLPWQHVPIQQACQEHLNWELFSRSLLNANNFYWRLSYGLRTAYAIESSASPAYDKPEHSLCA